MPPKKPEKIRSDMEGILPSLHAEEMNESWHHASPFGKEQIIRGRKIEEEGQIQKYNEELQTSEDTKKTNLEILNMYESLRDTEHMQSKKDEIKGIDKEISKIKKGKESIRTSREGIKISRTEHIETQGPDDQCIQALGSLPLPCNLDDSPETTCTKCYICGLYIDGPRPGQKMKKKQEFHDGFQCEHVLVVMEISLLCGLAADREGDSACTLSPGIDTGIKGQFCAYNECMNELFKEYLRIPDDLRNEYLTYRKRLLQGSGPHKGETPQVNMGSVYQWSHPTCNLIKNIFSFINIKFGNDIVIQGINKDNMIYVLEKLIPRSSRKHEDPSPKAREKRLRYGLWGDDQKQLGWYNSKNWYEKWASHLLRTNPEKEYFGDAWIQERIRYMSDIILQPIIDTLRKYQDKLLLFHAFSILTLFLVIKKQFLKRHTPLALIGFSGPDMDKCLQFGSVLRLALNVCRSSKDIEK